MIYFEGGVPEPFVGDEQEPQEILKWIQDELKSQDIKEVTKEILDKLNEKFETVGAVFVDSDNKEQTKIINGLVSKLDKIVEEELVIVQIDDPDYAEQLGLTDPPTLVQFSGDVPNLYRLQDSSCSDSRIAHRSLFAADLARVALFAVSFVILESLIYVP